VIKPTSQSLYSRRRDPLRIVQEIEWAPETVWADAVNLTPTGIRLQDRPVCSDSLYRLRYPDKLKNILMSDYFFYIGNIKFHET